MPRPRYADVTATLALVIALSTGGAYAATQLIHTNQIANNAVTAPKIAKNAVTTVKIPNNAVTSAKSAAAVRSQIAAGIKNVTMRTGPSFNVLENDFEHGAASCAAGEKATGGGVYPVSNAYYPTVIASFPTLNANSFGTPQTGTTPTGWEVWVSNNDTKDSSAPASLTMVPYVICVSP